MRAQESIYRTQVSRRRRRRLRVGRVALLAGVLAAVALLVGLAFAGSPTTLPSGTQVAGIDVGGLSTAAAVRELEARAEAVEDEPVAFVAAGKRFELSASQLGVRADWRGAVTAAAHGADGFGPVRGFRRLHTRFFGAEVEPGVSVFNGALTYALDRIAGQVDRKHVEASLQRRGLRVVTVRGRTGVTLDREASAEAVTRALASLDRGLAVTLPVTTDAPRVTAAMLAPAAERAHTALSSRVHVVLGDTRWRLPRWRVAELLQLPAGGATAVSVAGPGVEQYLERLARRVDRAPVDATFAVRDGGKVDVVPAKPGLALDRPATVRALADAAFSTGEAARTATVVVRESQPERTTAKAQAMGITGVVASYTTTYGGTPGRLHNVQLVSRLIDNTLIAPGKVFSFNETTGDRTAAKGFQEAPVIINGELQNGLGGGICQVSTTVFNAAFEAGLSIEERTNHALYISHYPLGRDATVNFPDLDLRFRNDTGRWLLLRTFVGSGSLTVNLYGTPPGRRVETTEAPLVVTGPVPVRRVKDPTLEKGKRVVEEVGAPPRATSVQRTVYDAEGKVLYDTTWRSRYVGEPTVVRVGTKPKPKAEPKPEHATPGSRPPAAAPPAAVSGATSPRPA